MSVRKIKSVSHNNKKKDLTIKYADGTKCTVHFGQLKIKDNLEESGLDPDAKGLAFFVTTQSGETEFYPYDTPLMITKDATYLLQIEIENLLATVHQRIEMTGITKKHLARTLKTSDAQLARLLDPEKPNKNFVQLSQILSILGLNLQLKVKRVA